MVKAMPQVTQKWRIPIIIAFAALGFTFLAWRLVSGSIEQRSISPDDRIVAEVRQVTFTPATEADQTKVLVRSRFGLFHHTVFQGLNYGANVKVSWRNSTTLVIKCVNSNNFKTVLEERRWGLISIEYEMD